MRADRASSGGRRGLQSVRRIAASERTDAGDRQLGLVLTFVAGAINAGGFLAVGQYTSHMSGIVSAMADHLALGAFGLALAAFGAVGPFVAGAACSAILINWGRRHRRGSQYALPLLLEAALLLGFGGLGALLPGAPALTAAAVSLLCFIMGLQNATITKVSGARIRTTHITGIVTDLGIELGKLAYWNRDRDPDPVRADRPKLRLLAALLASFVLGGIAGALGFSRLGSVSCGPLAVLLLLIAVPALMDDGRDPVRECAP